MSKVRKILALVLAVAMLCSGFTVLDLSSAVQASGIAVYVAPDGNDSTGDGSIEKPFKTVVKARDKVRTLKAGGMTSDITVYLRGGVYTSAEPFYRVSASGLKHL